MNMTFSKIALLSSFLGLFFGAAGGGLTTALFMTMDDAKQEVNSIINYEGASFSAVVQEAAPAVVSVVAL